MEKQNNNKIFIDPVFAIQTAIITVFLAIMYRNILPTMVSLWYNNPAYSHAFFIPVICGYFIWTNWEKISQTEILVPKFGLPVLILSMLFFVAGRLGAERFVSAFSIIVVIAAMIYYHFGKKIFNELLFPLLLLVFAIPLPNIIFHAISFKLQLFSSDFAVSFMQLFDIPVYNEGNIIHLFYTDLEVAEACSGIHSIISLILLSILFSYYFQNKLWKRLALIISSIPIAVITNAFRVAGTGILAHYGNIALATGFFHEFSGWLIFILAFLILIGVNWTLNKIGTTSNKSKF